VLIVRRSAFFLSIGPLSTLLLVACAGGSGEQQPANAKVESPAPDEPPSPPEPTSVRKRLQGTWEIVRYKSDTVIPPQAMPLMAELFDSLRLRFSPEHATVSTSKTKEERMEVIIEEEDGDSFKLKTNGNMFDGATCRFLSNDEWEVTDKGKNWPGVSILKRAKP
jgi:hypothetical protein